MFFKNPIEAKIDEEILSTLKEMKAHEATSEEYATLVERLSKLHKLQSENRRKPISPDTVLVVAANIFGILWLTRYERDNVITARSALSFVKKP